MKNDDRIQAQSISMPQGGGAIKGIGETFQPNAFSGTGSYAIPLPVSPARGLEPQLALSYNSGSGNSEFGVGFSLPLARISIRTEKGLPKYDGTDIFIAGTGELVPKSKSPYTEGDYNVTEYLPRIEGSFSLFQHYTKFDRSESYWKITGNDNIITIYGQNAEARIADEQNPSRIFEWLLESSTDAKGNKIHYTYQQENNDGIEPGMVWEEGRANTKKYIKNIKYGNYLSGQDVEFAFEIVFDYGQYDISSLREGSIDPYAPTKEWDYRPDAFSSYKSAFEIRTKRLCQNILLFHHFEEELGAPCLVKSLALNHETTDKSRLSILKSVVLTGYARNGRDATAPYEIQSMPATEFAFSTFNPLSEPAFDTLQINDNSAPGYLDLSGFQPIDFNGEGIAGLLYRDDTDRERFLETLTEVCAGTGWVIHAYVLMDNYYHILLETPEPNLVVGMKWFQGTYTQRFNARNREWGHLFQGRYRAMLVDNGSDAYFPIVNSYIHLNPARARLFDLKNGNLSDFTDSLSVIFENN